MTRLLALALSLLFVLAAADADAQRRRRRRRPPPPPSEEPAEPAPEEAPPEEEAAPEEDAAPDAAEGEDAPAAEVAPEPEPEPPPAVDDAEPLPDLGPLRAEFASLMDELVQARSRIAVLGQALFQTKVAVRVENRAGDQVLARMTVRIDGAPVFRTDSDPGEEGEPVFEGFAAPGPHDLTVEVEQRARADENYRYTTSDKFRFVVVEQRLTEITIVLDDDSDIAEDFADDGEGEYDVHTRIRVATRELREGGSAE